MKIKSLYPLVLVSLLATPVLADEQATQPPASQIQNRAEVQKQMQERRELMAQQREQRRAQFQEKRMNQYRINQHRAKQ